MTFCEYIERICGEPLDDYQKNLLQQMEENLRNGCQLYMPPKLGRNINIWLTAALAEWWQKNKAEV